MPGLQTEKTKVIPVGRPDYRAEMVNSWRLDQEDQASPLIPPSIEIMADGTATEILEAWLGNVLYEDTPKPWEDIINKVNWALEQWRRCRPTLRGKRLIVQMIVGGMTQYLTKVQGMPQHVEMEFTKIIWKFVWDDKRAPVGLETLFLPVHEGGIGLLDLESRNEAIELTWLRSYLDLSPSRPSWAYLADELLARSILTADAHVSKLSRLNPFLQSWDVSKRNRTTLPDDLRKMIRISRKYHVSFAAVRLSMPLKMKLPI